MTAEGSNIIMLLNSFHQIYLSTGKAIRLLAQVQSKNYSQFFI